MQFLSDLFFVVVGIAILIFLIKLFVSLRVVNTAPVWQEPDDKEPGAANTGRAAAAIPAEQVSLAADAIPEQKPVEQPRAPKRTRARRRRSGSVISAEPS